MNEIIISQIHKELRTDSRLLAPFLDHRHRTILESIDKYSDRLKEFGELHLETKCGSPLPQGGFSKPTRYFFLNESQCIFISCIFRNKERSANARDALVKSFSKEASNHQHPKEDTNTMNYKLMIDLMAKALRLGHEKNFVEASKTLKVVAEMSMGNHDIALVRAAVTCELCSYVIADAYSEKEKELSEYSIEHAWFRKNHKELIEGSEIVSNRLLFKEFGMIPDFIVKLSDGSLAPVECKKKFRKAGYRQLFAYMDAMKSSRGFAVARDMVECDDSRVVHFECSLAD
jgi:phage regulator Rha-like protein